MSTRPVPFPKADHLEPSFMPTLRDHGIDPILVANEAFLDTITADDMPSLALLDVGSMPASELQDCVRRCAELKVAVIALVPEDRVSHFDADQGIDDFLISPPRPDELLARTKRVLSRRASPDDSETVRVGDLVITPSSYEVSLRGKRLNLRLKEYELLLLMASNPGRVFTREALLNKIWGYEYLGGTRTVDVHIRRLRSKIEDADYTFIETVWQVGYRFRTIEPAT